MVVSRLPFCLLVNKAVCKVCQIVGQGPSVQEQLIRKYFPEEFEFEPFEASEAIEHRNRVLKKQEERRAALAHKEAQELELSECIGEMEDPDTVKHDVEEYDDEDGPAAAQ